MTEQVRIGFSGHRDHRTDWRTLQEIHAANPHAVWVHGDAEDGFDDQVRTFCRLNRIPQDAMPALGNPLVRNTRLVNSGIRRLYACYDGVREGGGTVDTMRKAARLGIEVERVRAIKIGRTGAYKSR